jgi:flavin reductase (DIM6/NTAB) family NADH-FMN oxidoreductase RutF
MTGAPLLNDAIAALECRVRDIVETGDHTLFVGEVAGAHVRSEEAPLTLDDAGWHYGR